jgi:arsenate reductase-like glutaredoxin family protein
MKHINSLILLLLIISVAGCETKTDDELNQKENQVPQLNTQQQDNQQKIEVMVNFTPEEEIIKNEILMVLQKNLDATQNEDVEGVLKTIHEDSPQLSSTKGGMEYVFKNYNMKYELEDVKFISITNEEVKAIYQQTTKAMSGTGFTNTRSIGIHTLMKSKDGNWKIFGTEYISSGPIQ